MLPPLEPGEGARVARACRTRIPAGILTILLAAWACEGGAAMNCAFVLAKGVRVEITDLLRTLGISDGKPLLSDPVPGAGAFKPLRPQALLSAAACDESGAEVLCGAAIRA